jgi:hypothetical protein
VIEASAGCFNMCFKEHITQLYTSPNYLIRRHVINICSRLGWLLVEVTPFLIQQSSIYDIDIVVERGEIGLLGEFGSATNHDE